MKASYLCIQIQVFCRQTQISQKQNKHHLEARKKKRDCETTSEVERKISPNLEEGSVCDKANPGGRYFLVKGYWGCAAGWGRIFTTGLTNGVTVLVELLEWSLTFRDFWGKTILVSRDS